LVIETTFYSVQEISERKGISMAQVALAWVMGKPGEHKEGDWNT
jgi:aryl-alcohol dehydrogenase-like predicted oxidoreductase